MEINSYIIFSVLSVMIASIGYITYIISIYKRETKPHLFTWLNWGIIMGIGAFAQFSLNGGYSAWVIAIMSAVCLSIAISSLFYGEKNITKSDWFAFIGGLTAIPFWLATNNPFNAIIIVTLIDAAAYYPTLRKSWNKPSEENPTMYLLGGLSYFMMLFTVPNITFESFFYPVFLVLSSSGTYIYILWRRSVLAEKVNI